MFRVIFFVLLLILLGGCVFVKPLPKESGLKERLEAFPKSELPISNGVEIYWSEQGIPFIVAQDDSDLAFSLGLVHAHLRLAQMEFFRRVSQGRLSESGSIFALDADKLIRTINFGKSAKKIHQAMDKETKEWLKRYVDGINSYLDSTDVMPHDFELLGFKKERWSVEDVITIGRLGGTDINWLTWVSFLAITDIKERDELWQRLKNSDSTPSFESILSDVATKGSNSIAISAQKSKNGSAIMANDPHLGISIPNIWVIVGVKSENYHAVGLMVPGIPFIGVGRNEHISWGGTNMRSQSSDLFYLPQDANITTTKESFANRWWFESSWEKEELQDGVVINSIPMLEGKNIPKIGMRWLGHEVSDEFGAFLKASRAKNWDEFKSAFESYALSGQNMLYADREGNIGQLMAVRLPNRGTKMMESLINQKESVDVAWQRFYDANSLPSVLNPKSGYLASSNNRPTDTPVPVSNFFSPNDRIDRMDELLGRYEKVGLDEIREVQLDSFSRSSFELKEKLCQKLGAPTNELQNELCAWDGHYHADSKGALIFQLSVYELRERIYAKKYSKGAKERLLDGINLNAMLKADIDTLPQSELKEAIYATKDGFEKYKRWGDFHRLHLGHMASNAPIVGSKYLYMDLPASGSNETLNKTAHQTTNERHKTRYGANARHISFMNDMDENYFVLLGGQDGWIKSQNFLDQVHLWTRGEYLKVPLRLESVKKSFKHKIVLSPKK